MKIQIFNDLYDAILFVEVEAEYALDHHPYFRSELLRLDDGRWRVGIITEQQMELDV